MVEAIAKFDKETKRKYRYAEIDGNGNVADFSNQKIGMFYISKESLGNQKPEFIKVTVEPYTPQ